MHTFHMQAERLTPSTQAMATTRDEGHGPVSLLLVDDNPIFLRILRRFLEAQDEGMLQVVGTAGGGREALALAAALRPQVVVLDLSMPELAGLELLPRLRRLLPQAGIITLTLLHPNTFQPTALAAGADAFVQKVTLDTDLLPAIRRVAATARARAATGGTSGTGTSTLGEPRQGPVPGWMDEGEEGEAPARS